LGKSSHSTWQDLYYDGKIDYLYEDFCEETQKVVRTRTFMNDREVILSSEAKREAEIDEWYVRMVQGRVQRIR
jgi:hypothetical protein